MTQKKKSKVLLIIGIVAAVALIAAAAVFFVVTGKMKASTIRLTDYEGKVYLSDSDGKELTVEKNRRLADGYVLDTDRESRAWVALDENRIVTLMERSSATFRKNGKKLVLSVNEGSIFFNIAKPLAEDESLDIHTSNILIGVRGTSGFVDTDENGSAVLYLTSGEVKTTAVNPDTGDEEKVRVEAGQKLTVTILDDDSLDVTVEDIPVTSLPSDLLLEINADPDLMEKIVDETGWDEDEMEELGEAAEDGTLSELTGALNAGGYVTFGSYEQDGDSANGAEPIEWEVLSEDANGTLLISRYVLDAQPYHTPGQDVTWETSSLRQWLNNDFYNTAFTPEEQAQIVSVTHTNPGHPRFKTPGGSDTTDRVFALSTDEVRRYYDIGKWYSDNSWGYSQALIIPATQYAKNRGVDYGTVTQAWFDSEELGDKGYSDDCIGQDGAYWWLRSPGEDSRCACDVGYDGETAWYHVSVTQGSIGVRPAIYVTQ